ncbi:hypothetical protein GCM10023195_78670 [Actinoallomurus liliacearum]|uniref:Alcohol dehydrogenase-like C-terminal domain-containing protein n=1 Tax=Actinoallomurus liliacearum TaxID=1080073 RepID=A0ABP8TXG4_9ACTN
MGDRVCLPFNIACGFCKNCERGFTAFCLSVNPGFAGGAPGDSVVVYGAGPVGLMAAYSAQLIGASRVMVVDHQSDRLALAEKIGAIPVDPRKGSPVEQVLELTGGEGADKGCECVGWQAHEPQGDEHPEVTMNDLVAGRPQARRLTREPPGSPP